MLRLIHYRYPRNTSKGKKKRVFVFINDSKRVKKDQPINSFEAATRILNGNMNDTLSDRIDMASSDTDLIPLMIQVLLSSPEHF